MMDHPNKSPGLAATTTNKNNMSNINEAPATDQQCTEHVLVVPRHLTKSSYQLLLEHNCVAQSYHLDGRYGSRTHYITSEHSMDLPPIMSAENNNNTSNNTSNSTSMPKTQQEQQILSNADQQKITKRQRKELKHQQQQQKQNQHQRPPYMGLPIPSKDVVASIPQFNQPDIHFIRKPYHPAPTHRAKDPPFIDAREQVHKEPTDFNLQHFLDTTATTTSTAKGSFAYAELFAGVGGFGVALEALGGECVFCSELLEECRQVYLDNFPQNAHILHGDIYQVQDEQFPSQCDLLVGGFPCQPFSSLGQQPGLDDDKGLLYLQIVRFLKLSQPKSFLLENVPGLLRMDDTYQTIVRAFEECGYNVTTKVCWARGVTATQRKRLFFVGQQRDLALFDFPYIPDLQLKACDVIEFDCDDDWLLSVLRLNDTTMEQLLSSKRFRTSRLAWPNTSCDTFTSHYGSSVGRGETQLVPSVYPHHPRRFSPRECARIMGFPNYYKISTAPKEGQGDMACIKELFRMFGNAVCPPLIAALAGAVLGHASKNDDDHWVLLGRRVAIQLAYESTIDELSSNLNVTCLPPDSVGTLREIFVERNQWKLYDQNGVLKTTKD